MDERALVTGRTDTGIQFPRREARFGLGLGDVPTRVVTHTFDVDTLFDTAWIGAMTTGVARPNVLIQCAQQHVPVLIERLRSLAVQPLHICAVGDRLALPADPVATLLVHDVSALTVPQQIELYDWMTEHGTATQVVAITGVPLAPMMEQGHFLQALFYGLNVLQAKAG